MEYGRRLLWVRRRALAADGPAALTAVCNLAAAHFFGGWFGWLAGVGCVSVSFALVVVLCFLVAG
jgi:hypothetical protein